MAENNTGAARNDGSDKGTETETEKQTRLIELARKAKVAMLTTVDPEGRIVSRPMSPQQVTDDGDVWFIGVRGADDVSQIESNPAVGVTFNDGWSFVSLSGTAEIVVDEDESDVFLQV